MSEKKTCVTSKENSIEKLEVDLTDEKEMVSEFEKTSEVSFLADNSKETLSDFVSESQVDTELREGLLDTELSVSSEKFEDDNEEELEEEIRDNDDEEILEINSNDLVVKTKQSTNLSKSPFSFKVTTCNVESRSSEKESVLSLVYTKKCGTRVSISKKLVLEKIDVTDIVQVAYSEELNGIILGTKLGGSKYNLKTSHGKAIIYNKKLVEYLKDVFNLDFSNTTTHSFYKVEFFQYEDCGKIAVITKEGDC